MHQNPTENDNVAGSPPPEPADTPATAAHRVAVFQCGDEDMVQAVIHAGLEIAYLYDAGFGTEHLDFDDIPPFDLVAAVLPDDASDLRREFELVLLFVRARTPVSFVLVVRDRGGAVETLRDLEEKTRRLGYCVSNRPGRVGMYFVVGTLEGRSFVWPAGVVP